MSKMYFGVLAFLCSISSYAQTVRTKLAAPASTDWSTASAWSPSGVPVAGERIVIPTGVTANISSSVTYTSLFLDITGKLTFSANRVLTLSSVSSYVNVRSGGQIIASNTANSNTKIITGPYTQFIGNVTYSSNGGAKGTLKGPANATGQNQNFVFGVILAQSLVNFSLSPSDKSISVRWTAKVDASNKSFEIQRSVDGKNWSALAVVPASLQGESYSYTDVSPAQGLNYYRLKTKDLDGKSWFSMIRTSYHGLAGSNLKVVPNPAVGSARVLIPSSFSATGAQLRVIDRSGQMIIERQLSKGSKLVEVDVKGISAGQYVIQLVGGNGAKSSTTLIVANQ